MTKLHSHARERKTPPDGDLNQKQIIGSLALFTNLLFFVFVCIFFLGVRANPLNLDPKFSAAKLLSPINDVLCYNIGTLPCDVNALTKLHKGLSLTLDANFPKLDPYENKVCLFVSLNF